MSAKAIADLINLADTLKATRITTLHEGIETKIDAEREIRRILRAMSRSAQVVHPHAV